MDQLINSLPALLRAAGDSEEIKRTAAAVAWNHVAGEGLQPHTTVTGLEQRRLLVAVADDIWRRQLESMRGQLLFRLNALLGQGVVTFIEFQVNPRAIQTAQQSRAANSSAAPAAGSEMPIPFELLAAAAAIESSKLRKAFLGAAMSSARRLESSETGTPE